ncbi:MAG TPA: thiamine pyrophosphate-dependent enzyme [Pirellulales bacterium]|jgi:thiamine pyrophosphate-dependent acetolactate synthase large subunit-like protein
MNDASKADPATTHGMPLVPALEVVRDLRRDEIVVTTMGAAREWPRLAQHPLDFHYIPSAMGHAPMLALGLALAQPQRTVVAFNGDGCMLMSVGCLVTIVASGAQNLTLILLENGVYEVTGGQQTAAAQSHVDFAVAARAAGFASVASFVDLESWRAGASQALAMPGPRFILLKVARVVDHELSSPGPIKERIERFRSALGVT